MRVGRFLACCLVMLSAATSASAQGGEPVLTDDPWTPRPSHWEINTGWELEHGRGVVEHALPAIDLNYGWGSKVELKFEAPYILNHEEGVGTLSGLGNPLAGVKWRFEDNLYGVAMSFYPQVRFPRSHAAARNIDVSTHFAYLLPVEMGGSIGSLDLAVEAGEWFGVKSERSTIGGVVAGWEINKGLEVVGECNADGVRIFHPNELYCGGGVRADLQEHVALMGALEPFVAGSEVEHPTYRAYFGVETHIRGGGLWKGRKRQPPSTEVH